MTLTFYNRAFMFDKYRILCRHDINKLWRDGSIELLVHLLVRLYLMHEHGQQLEVKKGIVQTIVDWMLIWYANVAR
jgi:hypothetical protein